MPRRVAGINPDMLESVPIRLMQTPPTYRANDTPSDSALDLGVTQQQLHGSQIAGSSIDQRRLRPPDRVGAEQGWVQTNAGDPLGKQAGVLAGGEATVLSAPPSEEEFPRQLVGRLEIGVYGLSGLLGDFELDRSARLLLPHGGPVDGIAVRSDILELEAHHVASPELAVDRQIEEGQVSYPAGQLQPCPYGPDMSRL